MGELKTEGYPKGFWTAEVWRDGVMIDQRKDCPNIITAEGRDHLLDVTLVGGTQITAWYVAPFSSNTTPLSTHTYAVPAYTEWAAYNEATRPACTLAAVSGQSTTSSASKASFTTITNPVTIYGAGLVGGGTGADTKSDTAGGGTLYASVQFTGGAVALEVADVLKVYFTCTMASA